MSTHRRTLCALAALGTIAVSAAWHVATPGDRPDGPVTLTLGALPAHQGAANPARRTVTESLYLHWTGASAAADQERADVRGCRSARSAAGGTVIVALGRQVRGGTTGFAAAGDSRTLAHLHATVAAYAAGLARCSDADWTVAVTTSNHRLDELDAAAAGADWAHLVTALAADAPPTVTFTGGIDLEPAWSTPDAAARWVNAWRAATDVALTFNASADGCPTDTTTRACTGTWTTTTLAALLWARPQDHVVPQIYRTDGTTARQWATIAADAARVGLTARFTGPMTQQRACTQLAAAGADQAGSGGSEPCAGLDLAPADAHAQLAAQLAPYGITVDGNPTDIGWG